MQYTESEIVRSYLRSGKKSQQITILAELNADGIEDYQTRESKNRIRAILIKNGVLKANKSDLEYAKEQEEKRHGMIPQPEQVHIEDGPAAGANKLLPAVIPPDIKYFPMDTPRRDRWQFLKGEIVGTMTFTMKTEKKPDKAAGETYEYTTDECRRGFLFMANYIADCLTAMEEIDPNSRTANRERAAYLAEIDDVRDFLSRVRVKGV